MVVERRTIQRDWLGHAIQAIAVVATLLVTMGLPMLFWINSTSQSIATLTARMDRQDRDAIEDRAYKMQVTGQMLDINKQLATIGAQLGDIREKVKGRR